jgi:hypothetical protein
MAHPPLRAALLALLAGCGRGNPGSWAGDTALPSGADAATACIDTATPLAGGVTPSGLSVDALWLDVSATPPVTARAAAPLGGADTVLSLSFIPIGPAIWHDRAPVGDTGDSGALDTGPAPGAPADACPDALELPGQLAASTADGALAERLDASAWVAAHGGPATVSVTWPLAATTGALDPSPALGDTPWDSVDLRLQSTLGPGPAGQVDALATAADAAGEATPGLIAPLLRWPPAI